MWAENKYTYNAVYHLLKSKPSTIAVLYRHKCNYMVMDAASRTSYTQWAHTFLRSSIICLAWGCCELRNQIQSSSHPHTSTHLQLFYRAQEHLAQSSRPGTPGSVPELKYQHQHPLRIGSPCHICATFNSMVQHLPQNDDCPQMVNVHDNTIRIHSFLVSHEDEREGVRLAQRFNLYHTYNMKRSRALINCCS